MAQLSSPATPIHTAVIVDVFGHFRHLRHSLPGGNFGQYIQKAFYGQGGSFDIPTILAGASGGALKRVRQARARSVKIVDDATKTAYLDIKTSFYETKLSNLGQSVEREKLAAAKTNPEVFAAMEKALKKCTTCYRLRDNIAAL